MFLCPICKGKLERTATSFKCLSNHCYDIASSGYVNLLRPGKKNNSIAGDSKEMIRARTSFFESCHYEKISNKIASLIPKGAKIIVDAGCGEGYYTENIAKTHTESTVLGFDMSKFGCEHGAKSARRNGTSNVFYAVGSIFELPLANESVDCIVNMFAPVASEEFLRVLKPGGTLIVASAGKEHLNGLKRLLYSDVYDNEEKFASLLGFSSPLVESLKYDVNILGNDVIKNLFTMTPYYHRTSLEDKKKLDDVCEISTTVEVNFVIYIKE